MPANHSVGRTKDIALLSKYVGAYKANNFDTSDIVYKTMSPILASKIDEDSAQSSGGVRRRSGMQCSDSKFPIRTQSTIRSQCYDRHHLGFNLVVQSISRMRYKTNGEVFCAAD